MAYIKKLVMYGFKSFAKRTEIPFDKEINLFVGANGSGKSNVAEALCFALGRLSVKSMRAAKARNLIFMGSKYIKPAKEAYVELILNNEDKAFSIDKDEIVLKRIVRANGQSIYKIDGETKARHEIIEMLAQAGIDPYGFNLIMQGQIQSIVRMHADERRKIIEEVAGISVYESRKEKSLRELEKTDERLKEISTILRERTAYLRNLEQEKAQAQKFKDAELTARRAKASILSRKIKDKKKEIEKVVKSIEEKDKLKEKIRGKIDVLQQEIEKLEERINEINKMIQKSSGLEQETLHSEISNLRAEIEGLKVRKESYENRSEEIERRIDEITKSIPDIKAEIENLRRESPLVAKKAEELKKKKDEFVEIEKERKSLIGLKIELDSLRERISDKEKQKARINADSENLLEKLEEHSANLQYKSEEECEKAIEGFKKQIEKYRSKLDELQKDELKNESVLSVSDEIILKAKKIKSKVDKISICPLCQSEINEEHKKHIEDDTNKQIAEAEKNKSSALKELEETKKGKSKLLLDVKSADERASKSEIELENHRQIYEKKEQLKKIVEEEKILADEIKTLEEKRKRLEQKSFGLGKIEERYENKILEIEEISSRTAKDIDTSLLYKERELENVNNIIRRSKGDLVEINDIIEEINEKLNDKVELLGEKDEKEKELQIKFKKMFELRDELQKEVQEKNLNQSERRQELREVEDQVNYFKIGKAKFDAECESLEMEIKEFSGVELLQDSINLLEEKLRRAQEITRNIGSINMRALEVYEKIKEEYDKVYEKVETLQKEKEDIMKIIQEIDNKKKKTFMKTFNAINEIFSNNFAKLSSKGRAYLEPENNDDIFSGGVNIVVKLAKGKYFDVTSLSGGEQTLVALSLLFAIQEYKPYHFYIFDEIDAALDKRNSERLAGLLNQYMKSGQYIVITHNDAIITNSNVLYGVSMHEGVSKILSLKLDDAVRVARKAVESVSADNTVQGADNSLENVSEITTEATREIDDARNVGEEINAEEEFKDKIG